MSQFISILDFAEETFPLLGSSVSKLDERMFLFRKEIQIICNAPMDI